MKLNNITIIIILLIIFNYPDVINKLTETILGKIIMISILTIISIMDLLTGILLLFIVLILHKNDYVEPFNNIKIDKKSYKEPFVTTSKDIMNLENRLKNR